MVTMLILLVFLFVGYVLVSYKKLIKQSAILKKLSTKIESENTDTHRREHNSIARDYNNTLTGFIGKKLAKRLKYEQQKIIEKEKVK